MFDIKENHTYQYIVAIGTSTGGPKALDILISSLPKDLSATYVIVQHMPAGFTKSLAARLDKQSEMIVKEAEHGEKLCKGVVYIAPGGKHLEVINYFIPEVQLSEAEPYKGHRPSVNVLLSSLVKLGTSRKMIGVIMTGMGNDGLEGMKLLKKKRKISVIAQDASTCVVYGMPRAIVAEGLHDYQVPIHKIAETITQIVGR